MRSIEIKPVFMERQRSDDNIALTCWVVQCLRVRVRVVYRECKMIDLSRDPMISSQSREQKHVS